MTNTTHIKSFLNIYNFCSNNNYLLSKHELFNCIEFCKKKFRIDMKIKYVYKKNVDDALVLFWLFVIIFKKTPRVCLYLFKKRTLMLHLIDINFKYLAVFKDFLYNINTLKPKNRKKTLKFYHFSNAYIYYKLSKSNKITPLRCEYSAFFKQEPIDYILNDLVVSSLKFNVYTNIISNSLSSNNSIFEKNIFFDKVSMSGVDLKIKDIFPVM